MKNRGIYLAIGVIALIVFSLVLFLLWKDRDAVFWITYGFLAAGLLGVVGNVLGMPSDNGQFAANLTLVTISVVYLAVNIGWSFLALKWPFLNKVLFQNGYSKYLAVHILLLGVFVILWLLGIIAVRHIRSQE